MKTETPSREVAGGFPPSANEPPDSEAHEAFLEAAGREIVSRCTQEYGKSLSGIVLTGSLARGEGTALRQKAGWKFLSDAELFLVFRPGMKLAQEPRLLAIRREVIEALAQRGVFCDLSFTSVGVQYLRSLRPHMFAYELRTLGKVLWGDPRLLAQIPEFSPAEIPLEDAWRLLCNRMIEMLELAADFTVESKGLPPALIYRTVKLYLDMATSLLLFVGAYEPTYQGRAERLEYLAGQSSNSMEFPFDLRRFSQRVTLCTRWKLSATREDDLSSLLTGGESPSAFWEEAVGHARLLWRWELERLTHSCDQVPVRELMNKWMRSQHLSQRLRGWLYVLRREGWLRSRGEWRRWARRAWQASPRYWVYAAASELFFRLPCLALRPGAASQANEDWREVYEWLPRQSNSGQAVKVITWRALAVEIVANYESFLTGTRS